MKLFIIFFTLIALSIAGYIGIYFTNVIPILSRHKILFWLVHLFFISTIILAPMIYRIYPINGSHLLYDGFQLLSYLAMGFYFVLFGFVVFNQLGMGNVINLAVADENRRDFLKSSFAFLALGLSGAIASLGYITATQTPEIVKVTVPIFNLPKAFQGLKIIQLSDVHVGQTIKKDFVKTIVDLTNSLSPDIIMLTGDFVDGSVYQLDQEVEYLRNLKAPLGVFYVPGNHEYYWGLDEWVKKFQSLGFKTLINQHIIVDKNSDQLLIAGVHDYSAHRISPTYESSPKKALVGSPVGIKKILLAHQPKSAYDAEEAGFDLQLSGHSHAGQFFPSSILIYFFQPFVKGLYRHKKMWLYVNRGTGYWGPPNRMGVPSEITLLELTNSTTEQMN